jgi:hypothetical protein
LSDSQIIFYCTAGSLEPDGSSLPKQQEILEGNYDAYFSSNASIYLVMLPRKINSKLYNVVIHICAQFPLAQT